jgi:hypothetical protein
MSDIPPRWAFYQNNLGMSNTADMTGRKPIAAETINVISK